MDPNEQRDAITEAMLAQKAAVTPSDYSGYGAAAGTPNYKAQTPSDSYTPHPSDQMYQPGMAKEDVMGNDYANRNAGIGTPNYISQTALGAPISQPAPVTPSAPFASVNDPWGRGSSPDSEVAPGVSLSSFLNYHWQQDPGNRSLLDTTTNYPMVPGPYSIGGLAANPFGTDPYANATDPLLSGHVTPYGGSGPPAAGYWASLAGDLPYQSHGQIQAATPPTYAPAPAPAGNPFDPSVATPTAAPAGNSLLQQSETGNPMQQPAGGVYSGLV